MRLFKMVALSAGIAITAAACAYASQLVYTPVNPTFGGSPQNGSWLLSQASAQGKAASGSGSSGSGFSIDFPSFGTVTQPAAATTTLPDTTTNSGTTN